MKRTSLRPVSPRYAAEALFKPTKAVASAPATDRPAKELVSLNLDSDVLSYFRADGPDWQDRINDTLRAAISRKD